MEMELLSQNTQKAQNKTLGSWLLSGFIEQKSALERGLRLKTLTCPFGRKTTVRTHVDVFCIRIWPFHFFVLIQKSGAKKIKANPTAPRVLPGQRTSTTPRPLITVLNHNSSRYLLLNYYS